MSINQECAGPNSKMHAGDEVALLPPVSGGAGDGAVDSLIAPMNCVKIVCEKIGTAALLEKIKCPADGTVVVFEGVVRNASRDCRTLLSTTKPTKKWRSSA
jgi:MoaE-MoaD fusion protein